MSISVPGEAIDLRISSLLASSPESLPVEALAIRNAIFLILSSIEQKGDFILMVSAAGSVKLWKKWVGPMGASSSRG